MTHLLLTAAATVLAPIAPFIGIILLVTGCTNQENDVNSDAKSDVMELHVAGREPFKLSPRVTEFYAERIRNATITTREYSPDPPGSMEDHAADAWIIYGDREFELAGARYLVGIDSREILDNGDVKKRVSSYEADFSKIWEMTFALGRDDEAAVAMLVDQLEKEAEDDVK